MVVLSSTTKFKWKNKFVYENVRVTWEIVPIEFFAMNTKLTMLSTLALKTFASSQISYLQSDSICVSLVNSVGWTLYPSTNDQMEWEWRNHFLLLRKAIDMNLGNIVNFVLIATNSNKYSTSYVVVLLDERQIKWFAV